MYKGDLNEINIQPNTVKIFVVVLLVFDKFRAVAIMNQSCEIRRKGQFYFKILIVQITLKNEQIHKLIAL